MSIFLQPSQNIAAPVTTTAKYEIKFTNYEIKITLKIEIYNNLIIKLNHNVSYPNSSTAPIGALYLQNGLFTKMPPYLA